MRAGEPNKVEDDTDIDGQGILRSVDLKKYYPCSCDLLWLRADCVE
jgi:hypothetical protein